MAVNQLPFYQESICRLCNKLCIEIMIAMYVEYRNIASCYAEHLHRSIDRICDVLAHSHEPETLKYKTNEANENEKQSEKLVRVGRVWTSPDRFNFLHSTKCSLEMPKRQNENETKRLLFSSPDEFRCRILLNWMTSLIIFQSLRALTLAFAFLIPSAVDENQKIDRRTKLT